MTPYYTPWILEILEIKRGVAVFKVNRDEELIRKEKHESGISPTGDKTQPAGRGGVFLPGFSGIGVLLIWKISLFLSPVPQGWRGA